MISKSDERHKAKLERRSESRRRHEARQAARADRDQRLRAAFERYRREAARIWAEWRAS